MPRRAPRRAPRPAPPVQSGPVRSSLLLELVERLVFGSEVIDEVLGVEGLAETVHEQLVHALEEATVVVNLLLQPRLERGYGRSRERERGSESVRARESGRAGERASERESEQASEREKKRMVCAAAKVEGGCFERCDGTSVSGVVV